jgi:hypothetical protein
VKDTSVLEVSKLGLGVNSNLSLEFLSRAGCNIDNLANLELSTVGRNIESLLACKT